MRILLLAVPGLPPAWGVPAGTWKRDLQAQYRQQEQPQQPQQPQPSAADDFWAAPKGYVENKLKTLEQKFSFRIAHDRDMLRLAQGGGPSVVRWVMSTPDPGRAMMLWYGPVAGNRRKQGQRGGRRSCQPHPNCQTPVRKG
jgi:hypothetical protein